MLDLGMAVNDDACDNAAEGEFTSEVLKAQSCVLTQDKMPSPFCSVKKNPEVFALFCISFLF